MEKLDLILKWIIIILGIVFIFVFLNFKTDGCNMCKYEEMDGIDVIEKYTEVCLQIETSHLNNDLVYTNLSLNQPSLPN